MNAARRAPPPFRFYTPVLSKVIRLRNHLLNHSYIYYVLGENVVTDHTWQAWADELVILHQFLGIMQPLFYDEAFAGWDGSTGYHLPADDRIRDIVFRVLLANRNWQPQHGTDAELIYNEWKALQ